MSTIAKQAIRSFTFIFVSFLCLIGPESIRAQQVEDIFSPTFSRGKTDGGIARATIAYWDDFYERTYFSKGISRLEMGGTGYYPYLRHKAFYEARCDHKGEIPFGQRWELYEQSKRKLMRTNGAVPAAAWRCMGPNTLDTLGGRMTCHAFDPNDSDIIWAGSGSGGLWRTTNGGDSWESMTDELPSLRIGAIALNPKKPDFMLMGTGSGTATSITLAPGVGVLQSDDGGLSWHQNSFSYTLNQSVSVYRIVWDPVDTSNVYMAATNGLWLSRDGGRNWQRASSTIITDLVINKQSPGTLYAAARGDGIYRTTDGGRNWNRLNNGLPMPAQVHRTSLTICDSFPDVLYASIADPVTFGLTGLYKTSDGGDNWTQLTQVPLYLCQPNAPTSCLGWFTNDIAISPADTNLLIASGITTFRSDNGGLSWSRHDYLSNGTGGGNAGLVYVDVHDVGFDPEHPTTTIYSFNDGGVQKSTDGGIWWERKCNNLVTAQIYKIASDLRDTSFMIGGFQDHGLQRTDYAGSQTWKRWWTNDGVAVNVDPVFNTTVYGDVLFGFKIKSTSKGLNTSSSFPANNGINTPTTTPFGTPTVIDPIRSGRLFTSTDTDIYRTTNGANSWQSVASITNVRALEIHPTQPNYIYAARYDNSTWGFFLSENDGDSWRATFSTPGWRVTDIEAHPDEIGTVFVTRNSAFAGNPHVLKSTNHGDSWTDITNDLPDIPVHAITINRYNTDYLYLATDLGVYISVNGGDNWHEFNDQLPIAYVQDIHFHPVDTTLRIATLGRGVWKTKAVPLVGTPVEGSLPLEGFGIERVYPNPLESHTRLEFKLAERGVARVEIYNSIGQQIRSLASGIYEAGSHKLDWDRRNDAGMRVASGVYYIRLTASGLAHSRRLLVR